MKAKIKYCQEWNYKPRASGLQAELEEKFGATVELIAGGGGIYEVTIDGKVVFDKFSSGRFPNDNEIVELIEKLKKWGLSAGSSASHHLSSGLQFATPVPICTFRIAAFEPGLFP